MAQTREELTAHLAERLCWQVAHGDDSRVARRRPHKPIVDGVYQMAESSLPLGVKLNDRPPGLGTLAEILAKYALAAHG